MNSETLISMVDSGKIRFIPLRKCFLCNEYIVMLPENKNKVFILGTRKTGCDLIVLDGTNCNEDNMDRIFGYLGNKNFYVCQPFALWESS